MKKIMAILLCVTMAFTLFACGNDDEGKDGKKEKNETKVSTELEDMMKKICKTDNVPEYDIIKLDKSNFEEYSFVPWVDSIEAVVSEGVISTMPHSLVLVKVNDADAASMAKDMAKKADIAKWICVSAEEGKVLYTDKYVLLAMTYKDAFEGIKANFAKVSGSDKVNSLDINKTQKTQ